MTLRLALRGLASSLLLALPAVAQSTWHVDASATPPGDGSAAQPYQSLLYALSQPTTVSGDTLLVAPGAYPSPTGAPEVGDLTIRATAGPGLTHITGMHAALRLDSGCTLEGFRLEGRIQMSEHATVRGCVVASPAAIPTPRRASSRPTTA